MYGTMQTMSGSEQPIYRYFEIPMDVKHDLVYCQQALANHICVHQKIAMASARLDIPNCRAKKSLSQMEKEIVGIGADQKVIFNRLRLFIDYFLLQNKVDRKQLTDYVSEQISMYAKVCGPDIRPIRVQRRLCAADLHAKFLVNNSMINLPSEKLPKPQNGGSATNVIDDDMKGEVMEFLMSPEDISETSVSNKSMHRTYQRERNALTKQESLLKPKEERISLPEEDQKRKSTSPPSHEAINLSRLKLKEALCKAKDKKDEPKQIRIKAKSVSPESMRCVSNEPNPITALSSSQSPSSSSSDDVDEAVGTSYVAGDSNTVDKETFMHLFGLCTHSYSQYLSRRHTKRMRRNCTNTDYHYGRLELFEKQYANKRNKRQFLYSPPATRAKKQRRAASDAEAHSAVIRAAPASNVTTRAPKSNLSSTSLSGPISAKVCVTCFKRNNLLECKLCQGKYHAGCHIRLAHASCRNNICPCCWRQKNRQYQQQQIQRKIQRAYQISVK